VIGGFEGQIYAGAAAGLLYPSNQYLQKSNKL
jgi:hypothetical protein